MSHLSSCPAPTKVSTPAHQSLTKTISLPRTGSIILNYTQTSPFRISPILHRVQDRAKTPPSPIRPKAPPSPIYGVPVRSTVSAAEVHVDIQVCCRDLGRCLPISIRGERGSRGFSGVGRWV